MDWEELEFRTETDECAALLPVDTSYRNAPTMKILGSWSSLWKRQTITHCFMGRWKMSESWFPNFFFFSQPKTTCSTICKYGSAGVPMFRPHCSIHRRRGRWSFGYVTELLVNVATRLVLAGLYSQNSCVKAREWMYGRK